MSLGRHIVGTCSTMCPSSEMNLHVSDCSPFEINDRGEFDKRMAIKKYNRSDAGNQVTKDQVRPLPVLQKTLNYLIDVVITKMTGTTKERNEINMYLYVRDRLRAIRSDLTIQFIEGPEVIQILETSCLFFIWAGMKFYLYQHNEFEPRLNTEQITQTLVTLDQQYESYYNQTGQRYKNEIMFRALHLLVYLSNDDFFAKIMVLPNDTIVQPYIQLVMKLRSAYLRHDMSQYLNILEQMPLRLVTYALQNSKDMWFDCINSFRMGFKAFTFDPKILTNFMRIDGISFEKWEKAFHILQKNGRLAFDIKQAVQYDLIPSVISFYCLTSQPTNFNCEDFIRYENEDFFSQVNLPPTIKPPVFQPIPVMPVEDIEIPEEISMQPSEHEDVEIHEETIDAEPEIVAPASPIIKKLTIIPSLKIKHQPVKKIKSIEKNEYKEIVPVDVASMIPYNLPSNAYATVLVLHNDESPSAKCAEEHLSSEFHDVFHSENSSVYIYLTKDLNNPTITSILNCEETNEIDIESIPVIKFYKNQGFLPGLAFNSMLRKAIISGLKEFQPFDLAGLYKDMYRQIIEATSASAWKWASANAVFTVINMGTELYLEQITSNELLHFMVPTVHQLITEEEFQIFVESLKKLKLTFLPNIQSKQRLENTTWPVVIKNGTRIDIDSFYIPLSIEFDPAQFIINILTQIPTDYPSEKVSAQSFQLTEPKNMFFNNKSIC